jgi:hypothetical protein
MLARLKEKMGLSEQINWFYQLSACEPGGSCFCGGILAWVSERFKFIFDPWNNCQFQGFEIKLFLRSYVSRIKMFMSNG